ncbi:type VI secretion system-associated protein TagO [Rodentibacter caecimuris]|uniref:type VI secretion system-associated protein TagO n=1 Tax=Rodentibacter caecimuris TaxID=1796644 RepID=UPI0025844621|nr:type VI secretion system-associated protein TagO [Rodentibacter heylii]
MTLRLSFICKTILASFLSIYSISALSEGRLEQAEQCVSIKSNINRLACFDSAFNTPVREQVIDERVLGNLVPKLVGDIFTLAKDDVGNSAVENNLELALLSNDGDASVYIACKDNITRFQIALAKPVKHSLLNVHIANTETNQTASKIDWQSAERGYLLDAGRGLYAIKQLKSILYIDTFSVSLPQENRQYIFKNHGLASQVAPIRKECGW